VKGHGGFIQVYSQLETGSIFTVYLPASTAGSDTEQITKVADVFHGQGETILFVDDETGMREMARAVLRRLNFKPVIATNGTDGLMQAAQIRVELRAVITDLHMPQMDGLVFARELRHALPDIPIIVASGRLEDALAAEFKALGVTVFLDKPFTEAQLAEALNASLQK
jgi:CheY-like chemotaxis protein